MLVPRDVENVSHVDETSYLAVSPTGHSEIVGMLLDRKADYVSSDSNGATPLHYASQNNFAVSSKLNTGTISQTI